MSQLSADPPGAYPALAKFQTIPVTWPGLLVGSVVVFLVALAARLLYPVEGGHFDEYYHVLAAQGVLDGRGLSINETGQYTRARVFTYMVAASMGLFGETLWAARLPSVVAGALTVSVIWAWARREGGRTAGVIAAGVASVLPMFLYFSTFCRFYMLQTLLTLIAAIGVYTLMTRPWQGRQRWWVLGVVGVCLLFGFHLQATTLIATASLGSWVVGCLVVRLLSWETRDDRGRSLSLLAALLASLIGGVVVAWLSGILGEQWEYFRRATHWAAANQDNDSFYHKYFLERYGVFWFGMPLLIVAAIAYRPMAGLFATWMFVSLFVAQSLGGMKAPRYVGYAMPFMILIWALAAAELLPHLVSITGRAIRPWLTRGWARRRFGWLVTPASWGVACLISLYLVYNTHAYHLGVKMLDGKPGTTHRYIKPNWDQMAREIKPVLDNGAVLLTSSGTKSLFHANRLDYTISLTQIEGYEEGEDDHRLGRPTISSPEQVAAAVARHPAGLVVIERVEWRQPFAVTVPTSDWIEAHLESRATALGQDFLVFGWDRRIGSATSQTAPSAAQASMSSDRDLR